MARRDSLHDKGQQTSEASPNVFEGGVTVTLCFRKISLALWRVYWHWTSLEAVVIIQARDDEVP